MAEETLTDKFWKLASYSASDLLGFGGWSGANDDDKKSNDKKKHKNSKKSLWPDFVCSKSSSAAWGGYDEPDAADFDVRGKNYLKDRIKYKSKSSLFKLANLEMYDCSVSESYHITTSNKSWYNKYHKQLPNDTFFFIYNMQLSSLNIAVVATFIIKTNQPPNSDLNNNHSTNHAKSPKSPSTASSEIPSKDSKPDQPSTTTKKTLLINDKSLMEDMLNVLDSGDDDDDDDEEEDDAEKTPQKTQQQGLDDKAKDTEPVNVENEEEHTPKVNSSDEEKKVDKKIEFTVEDIESIPNIEQKISHNDMICDVDESNLWCPKLGYKPYDESVWMKFLKGDELFINQRLKIIPRIVEGSWYFTFPQRPALLGMKTPQRCYRGPNYLEIDCEADQSLIASQITKAAYHISTYLVVDIMLTIEGQSKKELPERCIGGFQIRYVDSTKAIKLKDDDDDDSEEDEHVHFDEEELSKIIDETHNDQDNDNDDENDDYLENVE